MQQSDRRVALVTGGARGIGRAIALQLAHDGWAVAICYRTSAEEAARTQADIEAASAPALAVAADVADASAAEQLVARIMGEWGHIDALINGAGPYHRVNILDETVEGWHAMFANNLDPVFYLSRAVAPSMIARRWGRIITFGLATADRLSAQPGITAHFIAKTGVLILTRTLARTLAPHGITVNAVSPGFIDSGSASLAEMTTMTTRIPAGYVGEPSDATSIVRFLLSDEARYINGANIHVSGGWGL